MPVMALSALRQDGTLNLALPPAVARTFPEALQRLIGYGILGTSTLGWRDSGDPRKVRQDDLNGGSSRSRLPRAAELTSAG